MAVPVVLAETPAALAAKLTAIPERIRRGYESSTLVGLPGDAVSYYRELAEAGLTYFIAGIYGDDREAVRLLAEQVVPPLGGGASCQRHWPGGRSIEERNLQHPYGPPVR